MSISFNTDYLTNTPYFDLNEAIENYGFDFASIQENNFSGYIETFIIDYSTLRKNYIMKNYIKVREYSHKLKGVFVYKIFLFFFFLFF